MLTYLFAGRAVEKLELTPDRFDDLQLPRLSCHKIRRQLDVDRVAVVFWFGKNIANILRCGL
jgi:hypothetical protein